MGPVNTEIQAKIPEHKNDLAPQGEEPNIAVAKNLVENQDEKIKELSQDPNLIQSETHQDEAHQDTESETAEKKQDWVDEFVSQKLLKLTTFSSVLMNLISAPVRLYNDDNPLKNLINKASMALTKSHLLTYAVSGVNNAIKEKNPFLLFSFIVEGISAFFGVRQIYLFRGLASGIDGAIAGIQDRKRSKGENTTHKTWGESFRDYKKEVMDVTKEFINDPSTFTRTDGVHKGVISSWLMVLGSAFGIGVNDTVGAGIRDTAGAVNDWSLIEYKSKKAKTSGAFYLSGSIMDFAAHMFGMIDGFKPFRNVFHEFAIAADRMGQYLFLRYLEENKETKQVENSLKAKAAAA